MLVYSISPGVSSHQCHSHNANAKCKFSPKIPWTPRQSRSMQTGKNAILQSISLQIISRCTNPDTSLPSTRQSQHPNNHRPQYKQTTRFPRREHRRRLIARIEIRRRRRIRMNRLRRRPRRIPIPRKRPRRRGASISRRMHKTNLCRRGCGHGLGPADGAGFRGCFGAGDRVGDDGGVGMGKRFCRVLVCAGAEFAGNAAGLPGGVGAGCAAEDHGAVAAVGCYGVEVCLGADGDGCDIGGQRGGWERGFVWWC